MRKQDYDFAGWVTRADIKCSDGVTIKQGAFNDNHGKRVPLVWNHNYDSPKRVLGSVLLESRNGSTYGFGYFNETEEAKNAKEMVRHGDINAMSIGAKKIKRSGTDVIHGDIYEVSLVLAGANPGALIDSIITHGDNGDTESALIYLNETIYSVESLVDDEQITHSADNEEKEMGNEEKTIGDIVETMSEEQKEAVYALIGSVMDSYEEEDEEGDDTVKQNVFNNKETDNSKEVLKHSFNTAIASAIKTGASSLKQVLTATIEDNDELHHGINSIEMLFPEAYESTNGNEPILYKDPNTASEKILGKVHKSPFSKVRTLAADLTENEARAKGYVKGAMKKEEFFSLIKRVTTPTTVYKKQKIDRDDVIDIVDFDVVSFMNREMQIMLKEEIARAIIVGDGRDIADADKISETCIRPILTDNAFFTIQKQYTNAADLVEKHIKAMAEYRGTGTPDMFIDPVLLADIKLLKGTDNRYLFGDIPSTAAIAARFGVGEIIPTSFMSGKGAVVVNLADYSLGATKGGQITNFNDFDIDFNQYKYLIETRLSGALVMPKSAIAYNTAVVAGADDTKGGVTYGEREIDKLP